MTKTPVQRFTLLLAAVCFAYIPNNPLVKAEALLGLSPAPLERYLGIKNLFSGMTEGMHQLAHGELARACEANVLTPFFASACVVWAITGGRIQTRRDECLVGVLVIVLSAIVNVVHPSP